LLSVFYFINSNFHAIRTEKSVSALMSHDIFSRLEPQPMSK